MQLSKARTWREEVSVWGVTMFMKLFFTPLYSTYYSGADPEIFEKRNGGGGGGFRHTFNFQREGPTINIYGRLNPSHNSKVAVKATLCYIYIFLKQIY
jgi:hypothetical protein